MVSTLNKRKRSEPCAARCASSPGQEPGRPAQSPTASPTPSPPGSSRNSRSSPSRSPREPPGDARRLRALGALVQARTFHAAALRQLSYFWADAVGGPKPTLIDSKIKTVAAAAHSCGFQVDRTELRDLAAEIEWAKVTQTRPTDYETAVAKEGRTPPMPPRDVARVYEAYEELRSEHNLLDFESMLELTVAMIHERPDIAERIRSQYRYFVVDEFQDVNPLQKLDAWLGTATTSAWSATPTRPSTPSPGHPSYLTVSRGLPHATVVRLVRDYRSTPCGAGRQRRAPSAAPRRFPDPDGAFRPAAGRPRNSPE